MALIIYTTTSKALRASLQTNEQGYHIIRLRTRNKGLAYISFSFSLAAFVYAAWDSESLYADLLLFYFLASFFLALGIFMVCVAVYDRIEYNQDQIKQFRIFRKEPKVITWNDVEKVACKPMGPLLEIYSATHKIFIDLNNNGIIPLLEFMQQKLTDENKR